MSDRVDFDDYSENYNSLLKESTRFFSASEEYFARYKVDIVQARVRDPIERVLEYGCGVGRNLPFLRQAFPKAFIFGTDISSSSLEVAKRENPEIEFANETESISSIGKFDLIFVAGVYHHVPPPLRERITETLFERMSPGAALFVFEHNPYNPITRRIVNTCPYDADAVLLEPRELKKHLRCAGFSIEASSYCLFLPPKFSRLAFLERRLGWLPLGGQYWIQARRPN